MFWKIVIIHVESCFARRFLSCILWFVLSKADCLVLLLQRRINLSSEVNSTEGPQPLAIFLKFGRVVDGSGWGFFCFSLIVLGAFKAHIQSMLRLGLWPAFFFPGGSVSLALAQLCLLYAWHHVTDSFSNHRASVAYMTHRQKCVG